MNDLKKLYYDPKTGFTNAAKFYSLLNDKNRKAVSIQIQLENIGEIKHEVVLKIIIKIFN
jgi:hypothetical protein